MQRPQRRRRQRREEKVAWLRGLGRAEDVWTVAQETSTEVMVAGVGCEREKKRLQRREKGWQEKRESRGGNLVVDWWLCWLPAVEMVVGVGMVAVLATCGGGRKKKMQKKRICIEERENLAVAVPIAGEDLG
jgi:hypothetical protein